MGTGIFKHKSHSEETKKKISLGNIKHGLRHTKFYKTWQNIKQRCTNEKVRHYKYYGGKGVLNTWKTFESFKKDMYSSYLKHVKENSNSSIERIDTNGNYCKENCRWATRDEQSHNKTNNKYVTYKGQKLTFSQWSKKLGMGHDAVRKRIFDFGWSPLKAVSTPKISYKPTALSILQEMEGR